MPSVAEPKETKNDCLRLLDTENEELFGRPESFLLELPFGSGVLPFPLDWLARQRSVRNAPPIAGRLGSLMPQELLLDLAHRALADESPSQRGRKGMVEFPGAQEVVELRSACDADLRTDWVEFLVRWHRYTA